MLLNLTIPVFNEEAQLADSLAKLAAFLEKLRIQDPGEPWHQPAAAVPASTGRLPAAGSGLERGARQQPAGAHSPVGEQRFQPVQPDRQEAGAASPGVEQPVQPVQADRQTAWSTRAAINKFRDRVGRSVLAEPNGPTAVSPGSARTLHPTGTAASVTKLEGRRTGGLPDSVPFDYELVIANNGSTDRTLEIARQLAREHRRVRVLDVAEQGRGRALQRAWQSSPAAVLSYMDVDLSTDLAAFPSLIGAVASGDFDLAIGSRLLPGARVQRRWKRELTSRGYNRLVRALVHTRLADAQCGFKAISRTAAQALLPQVQDPGWFFDTELLVLAERLGYRICEIPVHWVEERDSRVNIFSTALADLRGLLRLRRQLAARGLTRYRG